MVQESYGAWALACSVSLVTKLYLLDEGSLAEAYALGGSFS